MSTKIYHGYIAHEGLNFLLMYFRDLVKIFEAEKEAMYTRYLVKETIRQIDWRILNETWREDFTHLNYLWDLHSRFCTKADESVARGFRSPDVDFSASCSVLPKDPNTTLILFYADNEHIIRLWKGLNTIKPYYYFDNTDKPENLTDEQWEERKKDWDEVLADDIPRNRGFSFVFCDHHLSYNNEILNDLITSDDERALYLIRETWLDKKIDELSVGADSTSGPIFEATDLWAEYEKTDDCKKAIEEMKSKLVKIDFTTE